MKITRRATAAVLAAGLTIAGMATLGGRALADPPSGVTPAATAVVGVGSDTTAFVMDAFARSYNAQSGIKFHFFSWDATNPTTGAVGDSIVTKAGCQAIARPNGGSAGVSALVASGTSGCIDYARTITPKSTTGSQNNLTFYAYGEDALTWVAVPSADTPTTLTETQLEGIYNCTITNWDSIKKTLPSNTIHPYLPQSGSALAKNFLTDIGVTNPGSCVTSTNIEQNEGTALGGDKTALVPYSIANWLAQSKGTVADERGGVALEKINGVAPTNPSSGTLNLHFPTVYLLYNVVQDLSGGGVDPRYTALFGSAGFICTHQATLVKYGFAKLGAGCGSIS